MKRPVAPPPVVLAAHGSRDPRSATTMRKLAAAVAARHAGPVTAAFLDFDSPSVKAAVQSVAAAAGASPVVVPALLVSAYHRRVDIPGVLMASGVPVRVADVLGPGEPGQRPDPLLLAALLRRLRETGQHWDGLVLIAAGTSHAPARSTVESVAAALAQRCDVAYGVGYAAGSEPTAAEAVARLRARGATRVAVAAYFLAPGRLYDVAAASARAGGAAVVAAPLGTATELVELVARRVAAAGRSAG